MNVLEDNSNRDKLTNNFEASFVNKVSKGDGLSERNLEMIYLSIFLKGIVSNGFINVLFNNKFGKGFWKWIQYSVIKIITNGSITYIHIYKIFLYMNTYIYIYINVNITINK